MAKKQKFSLSKSGFSLVELMIVVAITAVLSGLFLANLKQGEITRSLKLASDTTQSGLRLMQNNTLSGLAHPSGQPLRDYGMTVGSSGTSYVTFTEARNAGGNAINYQALETITLPSRTSFSNIAIAGTSVASLSLRFMPPFGEIRMTGGSYNEATSQRATFDIIYSGSTLKKTVTIDGSSGRIEVQ